MLPRREATDGSGRPEVGHAAAALLIIPQPLVALATVAAPPVLAAGRAVPRSAVLLWGPGVGLLAV